VKGLKEPTFEQATHAIPYVTGAISALAEGMAGGAASGGNPLVAGGAAVAGWEAGYQGGQEVEKLVDGVHTKLHPKKPAVPVISPSNVHTFNRMIPRYDSIRTDVYGQRIGQPPQETPRIHKKRNPRLPSMKKHDRVRHHS
jgi:hypothetical protein